MTDLSRLKLVIAECLQIKGQDSRLRDYLRSCEKEIQRLNDCRDLDAAQIIALQAQIKDLETQKSIQAKTIAELTRVDDFAKSVGAVSQVEAMQAYADTKCAELREELKQCRQIMEDQKKEKLALQEALDRRLGVTLKPKS